MAPFQNVIASSFLSARMPVEGRVLDAGCGTGLFGVVFKGMRRLNAPTLIGCDVFAPYLEAIPNGVYDDLVCCDIAHLPFRDKVFSGVASVEVIEHLNKVNALQALKEFERVTRDVIFLTTPVGYHMKTSADGNPHQTHLSGWNAGEFRKLGFKVRFLPDMSNKLWVFIPFALTYLTGIMAKTLICFKKIR
jgi:ubiquinone/menaquinone biosynthesis C-methylase UbiE